MNGVRIVALLAASVAFSIPVSEARADACQACSSSHSCDSSSTRGGCTYNCGQDPPHICQCTDDECKVSEAAPIFQQRGTTYVGPGRAVAVGAQTFVITTCQGDVRGVTYTRKRARKVEEEMASVTLDPVDLGLRVASAVAMARFKSAAYVEFPITNH